MSYEEFLTLGETKHHEYYDGLCVVNPPTRRHTRAVMRLKESLDQVCPSTHEVLAGWGWETPRKELFEPDLLVSERTAVDDDVLRAPPPLLVVEVSSPSTRSDDWGKKRQAYAEAGAGWYWIVDLGEPEVVVLQSDDGMFVEVVRIGDADVVPGPLGAAIDLKVLRGT